MAHRATDEPAAPDNAAAAAAAADVSFEDEAAAADTAVVAAAADVAVSAAATGATGAKSATVRIGMRAVKDFSTGMGNTPVASSISVRPRLQTSDSTAYVCPRIRSGCAYHQKRELLSMHTGKMFRFFFFFIIVFTYRQI